MNDPPAALELDRVTVVRSGRPAVHEVSLRVAPGERVFLLGPNGAGKTSLLLALVGALPFEGTIRIGETRVERAALAEVRRSTAFVFAEPSDQFFMDEVRAEVGFGPREQGLDERQVASRVDEALAAVGLVGEAGRAPASLSLGEQRRLALATALAVRPRVLLVDEPTASLDPRARRAVLDVLRTLDATTVIATHDLDAALDLGGRAVLLHGGRLLEAGAADVLLLDGAALDRAGLDLPLSVAAR